MRATIIERLALFIVPFVLYALYLAVMRLRLPRIDRKHPWMLLSVAGLALVALSFVLWGVTEGEPTTGFYVAPHMVNGKVVPGYVVPPEKRP